MDKLIEKYEAEINRLQKKRAELFKAEKYAEETILETKCITLYGVIKDLRALGNKADKSTDKALILSGVSISLPSDEEIREPIQNALYSTDRLTTDQCTELADGIMTYLNEAGYKVVRQ